MSNVLRQIAEEYKAKMRQKLVQDIDKTAVYTRNELYDEAKNMFNSFMDQFYSYQTEVYVRHGQDDPGTGTGINLYHGIQIRKFGGAKNPKMSLDFSGADMDGGYKFHTPGQVLESVMSGIRFPKREMTWSGSYNGKYFSYSGNPKRAFEIFTDHFWDIAEDVFVGKWIELGW